MELNSICKLSNIITGVKISLTCVVGSHNSKELPLVQLLHAINRPRSLELIFFPSPYFMVAPLNKDLNESNYTQILTRTMHINLKNVCKLVRYLLYPLDYFYYTICVLIAKYMHLTYQVIFNYSNICHKKNY
jgi:hypothetical protein